MTGGRVAEAPLSEAVLLTAEEVAPLLRYKANSLRRACVRERLEREGFPPPRRLGRHLRWPRDAVLDFVNPGRSLAMRKNDDIEARRRGLAAAYGGCDVA